MYEYDYDYNIEGFLFFWEFIVFIACGIITCLFLYRWYKYLIKSNVSGQNKFIKYIFGLMPFVALIIIFYALRGLASFDVVDNFIYIIMYILMGYSCIYLGLTLMSMFFDLSWIDDVLNIGNKAALIAITGGFLGITVIYSGANIGDGPGWWCVVFAGGLGLIAWIILGLIINSITRVFERITVERDISCGIRTGCYLLAGGIILARASAGDWTSFSMTVAEFMDGWPVLILTALMILAEVYFINKSEQKFNSFSRYNSTTNTEGSSFYVSVCIGIVYILIAVLSVILLPPLNINPVWSGLAIFTERGITL